MSVTPNVIRAACRSRFYRGLDRLSAIAESEFSKPGDVIKAMDSLGRFGLGAADQAQVHIHAGDGAQVIGVVHLPALEPVGGAAVENGGLDENGKLTQAVVIGSQPLAPQELRDPAEPE